MQNNNRSALEWVLNQYKEKTPKDPTIREKFNTYRFADVPEVAWIFYIGGYQPAQKWLKDRHGRQLTFDDVHHYQRMIVALTETGKTMEEVDKVGVV